MSPLRILSATVVRPSVDDTWIQEVPAANRRRDPRIWHMALVAAMRAVKNCPTPPRSVVTATALGALDETQAFLRGLFTTGLGSPRNFMSSVHNSMAGKLAIDLKITGPNLTLCDGLNSLASALVAVELLGSEDLPALVVAVDEKTELLDQLAAQFPAECGFLHTGAWEEGAAAFVVDRSDDTSRPWVRALPCMPASAATSEDACRALAASMGDGSAVTMPPSQTCDSFVRPGFLLHDLVLSDQTGEWLIQTHDPRSRSTAVIFVSKLSSRTQS